MKNMFERVFSSTTSSKFEDGLWKVRVAMLEKAKVTEDDEWTVKEIFSEESDPSFKVAYAKAMESVLDQFNAVLRETNGSGMLDKSFYAEEELSPIEEPSKVVSASELE